VYLPEVQGTLEEAPPSARIPAERFAGTETLLLVEDDDGVRKYVRETLQHAKYTVLDARNGGEALLIVEQHAAPIHLLLTDIILPRMTGIQLAARLRALRPEIRAVFMSGYAEERILDQGGLDAREALVTKPIRPQDLLRAVRTALDRLASKPPPPG
jgi:CheY-like chemotaxis protein